ncbi:MAG: FAD-dependent oxidoreductase [Deltaproteobacteria bacterium]|nr:FAD-dependent oxidoreductase [Deltaproteobacteria bacterium]
MRLAVVGGGVAGIVAANLLQAHHDVTLLEADTRLGGHTNTVSVDGQALDTGFIVLNDQTYPLFTKFLADLGVGTRTSDMSFGYENELNGLLYAGTSLNGLFAQRSNIFSPSFYRFLLELVRFCRIGKEQLKDGGSAEQLSLDRFLERYRFSPGLRDEYLYPIAGAIWSAPMGAMGDFPAATLLRFFANHGLLSLRDRPRWQTVVGGSRSYIRAFEARFRGTILVGSPVESLREEGNSVVLNVRNQAPLRYDAVVIASHADQALRMISDPSEEEREVLGAWSYHANHTVLHTDTSVLPRSKRAWASWNAVRRANAPEEVVVSYHLNRLQGIVSDKDYVVTLNSAAEIDERKVLQRFQYEHPGYDARAIRAQSRLPALQGAHRRYFCGSYFGYGFHEDAVRSAVDVAALFGVENAR